MNHRIFTHCRGCGCDITKEIIAPTDGLCGRGPTACVYLFKEFAAGRGLVVEEAYSLDLTHPPTLVALDEWLATR